MCIFGLGGDDEDDPKGGGEDTGGSGGSGGGNLIYVYQYQDHLGNIRLAYSDSTGDGIISQDEIKEENNYYPFGLKHEGYNEDIRGREHKYGFGDKEEHDDLGLGLNDHGARLYDPSGVRWMSIDPLADDPSQIDKSPYQYAFNNPLRFIDPSGMIGWDVNLKTGEALYDGKDDGIIRTHENGKNSKQIIERDANGNSKLSKGATGTDIENYVKALSVSNWGGGVKFDTNYKGNKASLRAAVFEVKSLGKAGYLVEGYPASAQKLEIKGLMTAMQDPNELKSELKHEEHHKKQSSYLYKRKMKAYFKSKTSFHQAIERGAVIYGNYGNKAMSPSNWSPKFTQGREAYFNKYGQGKTLQDVIPVKKSKIPYFLQFKIK